MYANRKFWQILIGSCDIDPQTAKFSSYTVLYLLHYYLGAQLSNA